MAKVALLIGVSDYEEGLDALPAATKDIKALQEVLINPAIGGFAVEDVTVLPNPSRQDMEDAIYSLFANRQRDDLVLLYFSGHGVIDDGGEFYFASRLTRKDQGRLVPTTATAARSVCQWMEMSRSQHKVIILDSCFSGAFAKGVRAKDSGSVNPSQFLGGKGTAILTASTSTQYALTQEGLELSVYTHYLVEGIRTGGADQDDDGFVGVEELHAYASSKVKEAAPAMTPEFYPVKEGYKILLAKSPKNDPALKYRKEVKLLAEQDGGDFSDINRACLDVLQHNLKLVPEEAAAIEAEELEPYRQRHAKVQHYRTVFEGAISKQYPLTERDRLGLQRLQQLLSLRDEDVEVIEAPLLEQNQMAYVRQVAEQARQEQEAKLQEQARQEQEIKLQEQAHQADKRQQAEQACREQTVAPVSQPNILTQPQASGATESPPAQSSETSSTSSDCSESLLNSETVAVSTINRQQFLKWAGFGGGVLMIALASNQISRSFQISVAEPKITEPGAGSAKVNGLPLWTVDFETVLVDERGSIIKRPWYRAGFVKEDLGNGLELELVSIPAGSFQMGALSIEAGSSDNERPHHTVMVNSFLMGKYPVTQAQWAAVSALPKIRIDLNSNPSQFQGANYPVESVSWNEAVEFCARLSQKTGKLYRLPSETEWEYACRAGTKTPFYFGKTITPELANYNGTNAYIQGPKGIYRRGTTKVGCFSANAYGLYDMHGNVWESCQDTWHESYEGAPSDGSAWGSRDDMRVLLGGSWSTYPEYCRCATRLSFDSGERYYYFGFRVVSAVLSLL
ncbi:MAG TPA: SUMF1/EgtB/PvdO family nonheme iron enzyme [Stenomitos sp.]